MTFLSFLVPLVVHYALTVLPLGLGLLQAKAALMGAPDDGTWFVVVTGLLPIALGGISLLRWSRL